MECRGVTHRALAGFLVGVGLAACGAEDPGDEGPWWCDVGAWPRLINRREVVEVAADFCAWARSALAAS